MYGLRHINNMYSEFAGTRSDFIIMGDPEYKSGKIRCEMALALSEFRADKRTRPAKSVPGPSADITKPGLYLKPLKQRALERSKPSPKSTPAHLASLDGFLEALQGDSGHPLQLAMSLSAPALPTNSTDWWTKHNSKTIVETSPENGQNMGVNRHYKGLRSQMFEMKQRMKDNPEKERQVLASSGAWRYYAPLLEKPASQSSGAASPKKGDFKHKEKWLSHHKIPPGIGNNGCLD